MSESRWIARRGACAIEMELREGQLWVTVMRGTVTLRGASALRLVTEEGPDLLQMLTAVSAVAREVCEEYQLAVGKSVGRHVVSHHEQAVEFVRPDGAHIGVVLRAGDDGVALRCVIHEKARLVGSDFSFVIPGEAAVWPLKYTPWYEEPRFTATAGALADDDYGLPFLMQIDAADEASYALVTESDVDGRYGGSFLRREGDCFALTLADPVDVPESGVATPWRVFFLGDLPTIVASHLVEDLAPAAAMPVPAWVRPGRAAWSWWSDFYSGAQLDAQLRLVDYAAEHGWEYVLVDCGWDRAWLPELVAAASARGVGIFVWTAWDRLDVRRDLAEWASWGVAGIKVDFMESESQVRYRWYDAVIAEAARVGLMVNFHGSVIPRGWARTFPHVVAYEAVRGAEYYAFYSDPLTPEHNTIVPFTRNVVGSADYTPVTFSTAVRTTSDAHELALAVVLESGITHFADNIDEYRERSLAQEVLDRVVAAWDETRLLGGRPGEWVAMARRHGDEWFVGVVSAGGPRVETFPLPGDMTRGGVRLVTDDPHGGLVARTLVPDETGRVELKLAKNGGAVLLSAVSPAVSARVAPQPAPRPVRNLLVAEPGAPVRIEIAGDEATLDVMTPASWPAAKRVGPTAWDVMVPAETPPLHVGVVTLRRADSARRSAVAHVRVVTAPGPGENDLVPMRPIAARNGFGPVERDQSNGGGDPFDGASLAIAGTTYPHGLGVCAPAAVSFAIGGVAERFTALVGIDDETPDTTATAEVRGDDHLLVRMELRAGQPSMPVDVDVRGVQQISLVVHGTTPTPAHVDWVGPTLHRPLTTGRTPR